MPTLTRHLSDRVVPRAGALTLAVDVDGGSAGVAFAWQHDNVPVPGSTGATHAIAEVTPGDAGVWMVTATKDGASVSSSATVVVIETATTIEPPYVWDSGFAKKAATLIALAVAALIVPLWVRGWFLLTDPPGRADTGIIAGLVAVGGAGLLAAAAFVVLVEVRGRARQGEVSVTTIGASDVAKVIDALGKLRTAQLLAAAGLLALAIAGLLGWQLSEPETLTPAGTPTPTPTATSTASPSPRPTP